MSETLTLDRRMIGCECVSELLVVRISEVRKPILKCEIYFRTSTAYCTFTVYMLYTCTVYMYSISGPPCPHLRTMFFFISARHSISGPIPLSPDPSVHVRTSPKSPEIGRYPENTLVTAVSATQVQLHR